MAGVSHPGKQPTVKEVALHAGVSPMTVSRTLAGGANVRPDLQETGARRGARTRLPPQ